MDVELREVRDFLALHPPYSGLSARQLDRLPARLHLQYFRRGREIVSLGAPNNSSYLLRSGAVDIYDATGSLVERADPGTSFGTSSVLSHGPSEYSIKAIEDSLVLVVPGDVFTELIEQGTGFAEFFGVRSGGMKQAVADLHGDASGRIILKTRISDLVSRAPIVVGAEVSIQQAAKVMAAERVSALLIEQPTGEVVGIITDRDLRSKVVAAGRSIHGPVTDIMTRGPLTIGISALAFEAMLVMLGRNVHHLPVTDNGRIVGLISAGDLMRLETANPVFIVGDIAKRGDADGIAQVVARVPRLVGGLLDQDASAEEIHHLVTAVADAATLRLLHLAEAELGPAPVAYTWLVLGSQARHELALASDQDHVLILADEATAEHDRYFAVLAEKVSAGLEACGFVRCPGQVMATNPRWRQRLSSWRDDFWGWVGQPDPDSVLNAQIFFDSRVVAGSPELGAKLRSQILALTPQAQRFLGHLAAQAVERTPPLGFFRGLVLEKEGEHKDTVDLKAGGLHPIIEAVRVQALAAGVETVSTLARIRALEADGRLAADTAGELVDAFEFLSYLRLRHQARLTAAGLPPDNHLAPESLSQLERKHLRDAFGIVRGLQQALAFSYRTHVMS